jgi:hypothetical protein
MSSASESRTKFNNQWPATFLFPAELSLEHRLAKKNFVSIFFPAQFEHSNDHAFQTLLSHCIDALDNLPLRPDFAFDQVWKALDAEFFRLKSTLGAAAHNSRFVVFSSHISTSPLTSKSHYLLAAHTPLQTCEYLAKRILDSTANPNQHSAAFTKRLSAAIGNALLTDIHTKYDAGWLTYGKEAETQRKLGGLLKKIIAGQTVIIGSNTYTLTQAQSAEILIGTILPQFRNERFHGNTRPPFRSSTATLKTYAHAYFLLIYSYALMLEVLLYRNFGVISVTGAGVNTTANLDRFLLVLGDQLTA